MTRHPVRRGGQRDRQTGVLVAAVALTPVLTSCGEDRRPKPRCQAGCQAEWDSDDRAAVVAGHSNGAETRRPYRE
jgi:hypothetical protein